MQCPYCQITFLPDNSEFEENQVAYTNTAGYEKYSVQFGCCPNCEEFMIGISIETIKDKKTENYIEKLVFPSFTERSVESEVPKEYAENFTEAASIFAFSPKASAALSRRLLQMVLRDHFNINRPSLAHEIDDFLKLKDVPSYLSGAIDAVRNIGNFAAHPLKETSTGMIVDVEPGEAEWLLDVLESLFDFAFVQPKRLAAKQDALNEKLKSLGKPPMKKI